MPIKSKVLISVTKAFARKLKNANKIPANSSDILKISLKTNVINEVISATTNENRWKTNIILKL